MGRDGEIQLSPSVLPIRSLSRINHHMYVNMDKSPLLLTGSLPLSVSL